MRALILTFVLLFAACRGGDADVDAGDSSTLEADYRDACLAQCNRNFVECMVTPGIDCDSICNNDWLNESESSTCIYAHIDYAWCEANAPCSMTGSSLALWCRDEMAGWQDCTD